MPLQKKCYGYWRTDKAKEPGYSHELISRDAQFLLDKGDDLDKLDSVPIEGIDTLLKAMDRTCERIPNHDWLGTRVGDTYEWMTFRDGRDLAHNFGHGIMSLGLAPEIDAEDKKWRFIGIQGTNRKEWVLT